MRFGDTLWKFIPTFVRSSKALGPLHALRPHRPLLHAPEAQKRTMTNALVWGGEGGIGSALVRALMAQEWNVAAISRKIGSSEATIALEADVSDERQIDQVVLEVAQTLGDIDLLVYAVGDIAAEPVASLAPETWARILGANLTGAFLATRASLPLLNANAHIVYVGALPANVQRRGLSAYAAAKAGLEGFAAVLAAEERSRRVTVVRPGAVNTALWSKIGAKAPRTALNADDLAIEILKASASGHQGLLDL